MTWGPALSRSANVNQLAFHIRQFVSIYEWIWMSLGSMIPDTPLEVFGLLVAMIVVYLMTSLVGKPAELLASSDGNIDHSRLACPSCGVVSRPLRARTHQISAFSLTPKAFVECGQCERQWLQRPKDRGRCPQCKSRDNPRLLDVQLIGKHNIARCKHCQHEWLRA